MADHYFSADPSVPFERERFTCEVWGHELTLVSGSGVFSRGHLDRATAVLFRETEPPAQGQFLDLGCGYGVIGLAIARAVPLATVTAVDVNERALAAGQRERRGARAGGAVHRLPAGRGPERRDVRRDLVEPADPDRQAGPARTVADLAAEAATRGQAGDGRRQEPRRRLPAAMAGGAGLPDPAPCQRQGVPGAGVAARLSERTRFAAIADLVAIPEQDWSALAPVLQRICTCG